MQPHEVPDGPLALDSDVFSFVHFKKGRHQDFAALIGARPLALPFPVVGEVTVTGIKAGLQSRRMAELEAAIKRCVVLPSDSRVVDVWAQLYANLKDQIGVNDMWIAACCVVHDIPLVTNNVKHFQKVQAIYPKLQLVHPDI